MNRSPLSLALAFAIVASSGCVDDGVAPEGARLLLPDAVRVTWDDAFNGVDDGLGTLVPVDLMVYDGATGEPLELVDIRFAALAPAAEILAPSDIDLASGACRTCVWDAGRDRYLGWRVGTSSAQTDDDGLARVYVWVDAFPSRDGVLAPVEVAVDLPTSDGSVRGRGARGASGRARGAFQILAD